MENRDTGLLISPSDIKLHRTYFNELTKLQGIQVLYRPIKESSKQYTTYGEIDALYDAPISTGCIFEEHPKTSTMKKLGWNSELQEEVSIIHIPYDLPNIQKDCLFIIPSSIDKTQGRVFKVIELSTSSYVYPASIVAKIGPVFNNSFERTQLDHKNSNFNLLAEEEE